MPIRRALLSVSDKRGLAALAAALHRRGIELLSTGGTAHVLVDAGLPVREVCRLHRLPRNDGRPPQDAASARARRPARTTRQRRSGHACTRHRSRSICWWSISTRSPPPSRRPDCTFAEAIENIDIGGPAMLRAAAKNHADVTVLVDPADYACVLAEIDDTGGTSIDTRSRLAAKAFAHTAQLRHAGGRLSAAAPATWRPKTFPISWRCTSTSAGAALWRESAPARRLLPQSGRARRLGIGSARSLQGRELSYNNIADADTAIECVRAVRRSRLRHRQARQSLRRRLADEPAAGLRAAPIAPTRPLPSVASLPSTANWMPPRAHAIIERQFAEADRRAGRGGRCAGRCWPASPTCACSPPVR